MVLFHAITVQSAMTEIAARIGHMQCLQAAPHVGRMDGDNQWHQIGVFEGGRALTASLMSCCTFSVAACPSSACPLGSRLDSALTYSCGAKAAQKDSEALAKRKASPILFHTFSYSMYPCSEQARMQCALCAANIQVQSPGRRYTLNKHRVIELAWRERGAPSTA